VVDKCFAFIIGFLGSVRSLSSPYELEMATLPSAIYAQWHTSLP
jgi:hypothetical protein